MKKTCENTKDLIKTFGTSRAKKIQRRLAVLDSADCLEDVPHTPPMRRHQLDHNRNKQFAVDIEKQWRIIFEPNHEEMPRSEDGGIDLKKVTSILITNIGEDYHK